jgi:hypothetical protein
MTGKLIGIFIVIAALIAGGSLYYLQVYGYYDRISVAQTDGVQLTALATGAPEPILFENFEAIDSDSSPIRFRACFKTSQSLALISETYVAYDGAEPLVAPGWFDCFDADEIGDALADGTALPFLWQENIHYGIDRVAAIFPDGRGFAWHQINACGAVVFDGKPVPAGCPPPPERTE